MIKTFEKSTENSDLDVKCVQRRKCSEKEDEGYCSPASCGESLVSRPQDDRVFSVVREKMCSLAVGSVKNDERKIYKVVLTGGPCGGKTTGMASIFSFFESLGWRVFTVPESATIMLGLRIRFAQLTPEAAYDFQKDILKTMLQIEEAAVRQAAHVKDRHVLILFDRGAMDPSAYMPRDQWLKLLNEVGVDEFDLLNNRYNQVVHMVTAADGAERFYTVANNATRSEGIAEAKKTDENTRNVWLGHPYFDIIDNSDVKGFEDKVLKAVQAVADRCGIVEAKDRLDKNSRKRKWLVAAIDESKFPSYEDYYIKHDYLVSDSKTTQVRVRLRRKDNKGESYSITVREFHTELGESIETRQFINQKEYNRFMGMADQTRAPLHKKRRIFMYGNHYFNLDMYQDPLPPCVKGKHLMFLECYTTQKKGSPLPELPDCLTIVKEITGEKDYSMYTLSKLAPNQTSETEFIGSEQYKDE